MLGASYEKRQGRRAFQTCNATFRNDFQTTSQCWRGERYPQGVLSSHIYNQNFNLHVSVHANALNIVPTIFIQPCERFHAKLYSYKRKLRI